MAYYTYITIDGIHYPELVSGEVISSVGENNTSSNFNLTFENHNGRYNDLFTLNKEVVIYIDNNPITNPATANKILTGIIERRQLSGSENNQMITLQGRDYTAYLQDVTVKPEVYNNELVEDIIEDIFIKYVDGVTYNKVPIGISITRIVFKHSSIFDSLKRLADLTGCIFWIDADKVCHFAFEKTVSSGEVFDNSNIIKAKWKKTDREIYNQVWVYGDRYLDGYEETFIGNGVGSVFGLEYSPHSTFVKVNGSLSKGGIFGQNIVPASGTQHLIDFFGKKIVFTSGTQAGNNIPASGATITIQYDRELPIVRFGRDNDSVLRYGVKEKVIIDKGIKSIDEAEDTLATELTLGTSDKLEGTIDVQGVYYLTASQTCIINLPNDGINNKEYSMIEISYNLNPIALQTENIITIKLNKRLKTLTDELKNLMLDVKKLQGDSISETSIITRYEFSINQQELAVSGWKVTTRAINDGFIIGHTHNSIIGSFTGNPIIGDQRSAAVIQASGGYT